MQNIKTSQYDGMIDIASKDYDITLDNEGYGNEEISSQLVSLYRNKKKALNEQSKIDKIEILYDKNGYILGGKKLRRQIKNLISNLEEEYNLTSPSDELKLENLSARIINLKSTLKKVNSLIKEKELRNDNKKNSNNIDKDLIALTKIEPSSPIKEAT